MIACVESNFVLELALRQEEHEACDAILRLANSGAIRLVLPAFSISEPYDTLTRRQLRRTRLYEDISNELRQLSRTRSYAEQVGQLAGPLRLLVESGEDELRRLDETLTDLLRIAEPVDVRSELLTESLRARETHGFTAPDALVYASILEHLRSEALTEPKVFLNRNSRDFLTPDIVADLQEFACEVIPSFDDGLARIDASLA